MTGTSPDGRVSYETDGPVAVITLDRPQRHNALTVVMIGQLAEAVACARADDSVRAVVLTGAGDRAFCAGGLEMLLGTDLRIAAQTAVFGLPETRWGLIPGAGSHVRLPQQVPWAIAMQLLLTAEPIDAQRAYAVGLVNEVLPAGQVLPRALELARLISRNGPLAVQAAKEIAVRALGNEPRFTLEHEIHQQVLRTADAREGPRAFT
jgi:enoyl-CoA hydratase